MKTSFYLKNWLFYFLLFPSFLSAQNNFFEHFSIVNLPYRASSYTLWKDTISPQYVVENIFEKANKKGIPTFHDFWREESKQMTIDALEAKYINIEKKQYAALNAGYGVILPYSSHFRTIIFHLSPLLMEGSYDYSYIVTFDFDNNMIDALQIAAKAGYVDVQTETESLIGRNGKITTQQTIKKYEKISIDNVPDLVENAHFVYQIDDKSGKIQLISQNYSGFSGNFVNNNEKWQLLHSPTQLKILYEITFNNTLQELEVVFYDRDKGKIIAQNNQKQQYHLQFNPKKTHFTYSYQNKNGVLERVED